MQENAPCHAMCVFSKTGPVSHLAEITSLINSLAALIAAIATYRSVRKVPRK
jgi:hypothetical protein